MDYCDVAWSSIGKIARDKLDRAQRRATKIVLKTTNAEGREDFKVVSLAHEARHVCSELNIQMLEGIPTNVF